MDNGKISDFVSSYEASINLLFEVVVASKWENEYPDIRELKEILQDKRDFGIEKYGEKSFQISKENSIKVDTKQHALDELIDYINYMLHEIYKSSLLDMHDRVHSATSLVNKAVQLYIMTQQL